MAEVLPQLERKIIVDDKGGNMVPLLPLYLDSKPQPQPQPEPQPPPACASA